MAMSTYGFESELIDAKYIGYFFVDSNMPFVRKCCALNIPSVCKYSPLDNINGFTIIELLVTLAVVAVLISIAAPTMRTTIQNNRIVTLTNDLLSDINYARTESLKRGLNTGLCRSSTGTSCDGAGSTWQGGRIVFADTNEDMAFTAGTDQILRARETMTSNTLTTATAPNPLIFNARGRPLDSAGRPSEVTVSFSLCDSRGPSAGRTVQINRNGQVSSAVNPASC